MIRHTFHLALVLVFFLGSHASVAQGKLSYTEFGIGIGSLNYSGDIATTNTAGAVLTEARPSFAVYAKRHFNDWFAMGVSAGSGWFYANDANHDNPQRGLEVWTSMTQVNLDLEANLIRYGKFHFDRKFGLYVKAGGGILAYNPHLTYNNSLPDNVEPYPNSYYGANFFVGPGIKFRTSMRSTLRIEMTFHSTGSDYLDGFVLTNEVGDNDSYKSLLIGYSILIL